MHDPPELGGSAGQLLADVMLGRTPEIDIAPFAPDRFGHGETEAELAVI